MADYVELFDKKQKQDFLKNLDNPPKGVTINDFDLYTDEEGRIRVIPKTDAGKELYKIYKEEVKPTETKKIKKSGQQQRLKAKEKETTKHEPLGQDWLEKKVKNPETGNMVKVKSLPPELQKKYKPKVNTACMAKGESMKANEILNEKEALTVIAELRKHGISTRVTKVAKNGYVVKAEMPEELEEKKEEKAVEMTEEQMKEAAKQSGTDTILPEEKSQGTEKELMEQKMVNAEDEECAEEEEENVVTQAADLMEKEMEQKAEEEEKEAISEDEMMDEKEAMAMLAMLGRNKIAATLKPLGRKKYAIAVAEEDMEKVADLMMEAPEEKKAEEEKKEDEIKEQK